MSTETFLERRAGSLWGNAVVGALVAVVLSFLPFSPVLGGGVAGYLRAGSRSAGATVGAAAGLLASLPVLAVFGLVASVLGLGTLGALTAGSVEAAGLSVAFALLVVVGGLFAVGTVVALSAVGGYVGAILAERERPAPEGEDVLGATPR
jgi:hypothetical protein